MTWVKKCIYIYCCLLFVFWLTLGGFIFFVMMVLFLSKKIFVYSYLPIFKKSSGFSSLLEKISSTPLHSLSRAKSSLATWQNTVIRRSPRPSSSCLCFKIPASVLPLLYFKIGNLIRWVTVIHTQAWLTGRLFQKIFQFKLGAESTEMTFKLLASWEIWATGQWCC